MGDVVAASFQIIVEQVSMLLLNGGWRILAFPATCCVIGIRCDEIVYF